MAGRAAPLPFVLLIACGSPETETETEPPATCRFASAIDQTPPPPLHTPRWAFEPWISKDISSTDDTRAFVGGFSERDIPVGVVVLDSPWETNYNTFLPHPERYRDFEALTAELRAQDIRLVVWMTQMVNETSFDFEAGGDTYSNPSPNYQAGLDCGFYVNGGESFGWWKGLGAAVDFFHPEAVGWWHRQQDPLFDLGVAGFKLDFGDSYVRTDSVTTHAGAVAHQAYSEAYYRDFFAYGAARVGLDEFVTMVRPWDESYDFAGRFYARPEHAPVTWVGDNRRDWVGLADALDHIFRSAVAGYVVLGSDIGGYLDVDDKDISIDVPFDTLVFQRWTAIGALTPFMQLHGRANITPWTVPDDAEGTVTIYRYWASLHHQLVPFFFSLAEAAYAGAPGIVRPIGDADSWAGDYRYALGDALLVAPVLDASGVRDVTLPEGRWYDWWLPEASPIDGPTVLSAYDASDPQHLPLFVREGAIIPLADASPVTGLGTEATRDQLTVLVYPGAATSFELYEDDGGQTTIEQTGAAAITISLSRVRAATWLRVRLESMPAAVATDAPLTQHADRAALDAADSGWFYEPFALWIKLPVDEDGSVVTVTP